MVDKSTHQVLKKWNPNPTGKGGFREHPEHQSPGGWDKNNTYSYWLHYFKSLDKADFLNYPNLHPDMTMAAWGAYGRIKKSDKDRLEFAEAANRTEGLPQQSLDITSKGEKIAPNIILDTKQDK